MCQKHVHIEDDRDEILQAHGDLDGMEGVDEIPTICAGSILCVA